MLAFGLFVILLNGATVSCNHICKGVSVTSDAGRAEDLQKALHALHHYQWPCDGFFVIAVDVCSAAHMAHAALAEHAQWVQKVPYTGQLTSTWPL